MNSQVIITGANGSLGKYLSLFFLSKGYELLLISKNKTALNSFQKKYKKQYNNKIITLSSDFNNEKSVLKLCKDLKKKLNYPILLINNAAIHGPVGPFNQNDLKQWQKVFNINFFSHIKIIKTTLNVMVKNKNGTIVSLAGGGAVSPRENFNAYSSSKTALVRFSENLSLEFAKYNININCISPGVLRSDLQKEIIQNYSNLLKNNELKKLKISQKQHNVNLLKVSKFISFLISKKGKKITGKIISSKWDNFNYISDNSNKIHNDMFTLRRIV
jgi:short-subunit dehydrogenase